MRGRRRKGVNLGMVGSRTLIVQLYELGVVRAIILTIIRGPVKIRYTEKLKKLLSFVKLRLILWKHFLQPQEINCIPRQNPRPHFMREKAAHLLIIGQHLAWHWHLTEWKGIITTHNDPLRSDLLADELQQVRVVHQTVEPDVLLIVSEMGLWRHTMRAVRHQIWTTVVSVLDSSEEMQVGAASVGKAET